MEQPPPPNVQQALYFVQVVKNVYEGVSQIIFIKEHIFNGLMLCISVCSGVENYYLTYNQIFY